jgi:hypothetical protein
MKTFAIALIVAAVAAVGFVAGRTIDDTNISALPSSDPPKVTPTGEGKPSPSATPQPARLTPHEYRPILRYFATIDEENLPEQGILGGTMVAGTVAFPKGFEARRSERFYVVGGDGHILETWTYEIRKNGSFGHLATQDGYAPDDFEARLGKYDVYLWRPARYIPAQLDQ